MSKKNAPKKTKKPKHRKVTVRKDKSSKTTSNAPLSMGFGYDYPNV